MKMPEEIGGRFVAELTRAVGSMLGTSASSRSTTSQVNRGFVVTIASDDHSKGELAVCFGRSSAEALARAVHATAGEVAEALVVETLTTVCSRVLGAFAEPLAVVSVQPPAETAMSAQVFTVEIVLKGHEIPLHVGLAGAVEILDPTDAGQPGQPKTLDVILDLDLPLVVRFGRTELPLRTLTSLGPGSVIDLGRSPDEPVDVLISNRVVARGDVVIVGGNYGVRVRDVVSPAERARSLEAEIV